MNTELRGSLFWRDVLSVSEDIMEIIGYYLCPNVIYQVSTVELDNMKDPVIVFHLFYINCVWLCLCNPYFASFSFENFRICNLHKKHATRE